MASACVIRRYLRSGPRWTVRYRLGGRSSKQLYYGSYRTEEAAQAALEQIRLDIASGRAFGDRHPEPAKRAGTKLVYFARIGELVKIGVSADPARRVKEFNAELLFTEPGGHLRERELHHLYAAFRVRGEWFKATGALLHYLRDHEEQAA